MIYAIFAIDNNGGMGYKNSLPWPALAEDMDWFRLHTLGHIVVMGRGTYNSQDMPRPLPNRINWVVSNSTLEPYMNGVNQSSNCPIKLCQQLELENPKKIIWVIGGAKIITSMTDIFDRMYVTHVKDDYICDTHINFSNLSKNYRKIYNKKSSKLLRKTSNIDTSYTLEYSIYEKLS